MKKNNSQHSRKVRVKAGSANLSALAMSMVLPHENKPMRLPVVPATLTALLDTMSDATYTISTYGLPSGAGVGAARKAFLCRDPCYPLWVEKVYRNCGAKMSSFAVELDAFWNVPTGANEAFNAMNYNYVIGAGTGVAIIDDVAVPATRLVDEMVLASDDAEGGTLACFVPPGTAFCCQLYAAGPANSTVEVDVEYRVGGEEKKSTLVMTFDNSDQYVFAGFTGASMGYRGEVAGGFVPSGFVTVTGLRTGAVPPNNPPTPDPRFHVGWVTGGTFDTPTGTVKTFGPFAMPPEFNNSTLPYSKTRLNASAALFTNVTAVMNKEGTVLAARLKADVVEPWSFTESHLNGVHPSLRYFGALENGLYTFTTPSGNVDGFTDNWVPLKSSSAVNRTARPLFNSRDIGMYNAMIFTDLYDGGTITSGTTLAVSCYCHLEFETSSSLFAPGVSLMPMEVLHAAEVALLKFGHFHENPLHWATIATAAKKALSIVAPMVAPYVKQAAGAVLTGGYNMLMNKMDNRSRNMQQAAMQKPKAAPSRPGKKQKKPARKK